MTYQPGDHVFTSHQGDIYKCLVLAVDGDNYTIAPIDNEPGAWQGERHLDRLRPRRYERVTVDNLADDIAARMWELMEQILREVRHTRGKWHLTIESPPPIECEHCGNDANQGDHAPIIDSITGETTHACGYPEWDY